MKIINHGNTPDLQTTSSPSTWTWAFIACIFILALCLRLYHIHAPPLDFEPERQYHSYILARYYFLQQSDLVPKWRLQLWKENIQLEYVREPPLLEYLASFGYQIHGKEEFWIPKVLSVIFWMMGGVVLLNIVRNLMNLESAIIASGYYLLNPFAISASRAFMPDPLMILLALLAISSFIKYFFTLNITSFAASVICTGLCGIIKPFCLLPLIAAFICLSFNHSSRDWKKVMQRAGLFIILIIAVTAPYYLFGLLPENGFLRGYSSISFTPRLWFEPYYWGGWFDLIRDTTGYVSFILGLIGIVIAGKTNLRVLLIGLWAGYLCFGLIFTYHIHTHDYYHLMLTPIVAISLVPIGSVLAKMLRTELNQSLNRSLLAGVILFACAVSIHEARARWKNVVNYVESEVSTAVEIGETVNHSTKLVSLASYYAKPLKYHGEIGGTRWPYSYDFLALEKLSLKNEGTFERLEQIKKQYSPEYFIVADLTEFNYQKELKALLYNNYKIFKETDRFVIFSLKK